MGWDVNHWHVKRDTSKIHLKVLSNIYNCSNTIISFYNRSVSLSLFFLTVLPPSWSSWTSKWNGSSSSPMVEMYLKIFIIVLIVVNPFLPSLSYLVVLCRKISLNHRLFTGFYSFAISSNEGPLPYTSLRTRTEEKSYSNRYLVYTMTHMCHETTFIVKFLQY